MPNAEDIARLPAMERDILRLHLSLRKSQTEVAKILGVSQPTVNYRYARARARLEFMEKIPRVTPDEIRKVLRELGARDSDVEAMALYAETSSQSEVARRMNTSQGAVRHWILRALVSHLQSDMHNDDAHRRVRNACQMLVGKPGILNEPIRPDSAASPPSSEHLLPQAPKVQGRLLKGERVILLEGLYRDMEGDIVRISDESMSVCLRLESKQITLTWRR
jgi:predicted transcriptional regulator